MTVEKWFDTKEYFIAYSIMIIAARHQGFATYQEIAQAVGLPTAGSYMGGQIGGIIGAVSKNEIEQGRPMLSAIVIGTNGKPGGGFIPWAKELGLFIDGQDETEFWKKECRKVYDAWRPTYRISKTK
jgi:hypothetical protein